MRPLIVTAIPVLLAVGGCSSSGGIPSSFGSGGPGSPGPSPTIDAGSSGGDDGGGEPIGGDDGGIASGGGGDAGTIARQGQITLQSQSDTYAGAVYQEGFVAAAFDVVWTAPGPSGCTRQSFGDCTVTLCDSTRKPQSGATEVSAGVVSVGGGLQPAQLTDSPPGNYSTLSFSDGAFFRGGELLTASATGAVVPPFTLSVQDPSAVTVTSTTAPQGQMWHIPRSAPLTLDWIGATAGSVVVVLTATNNLDQSNTVRCSFSGQDSSGQIPMEALSLMPSAPGTIEVESFDTAETTLTGGWHIVLESLIPALDSTGAVFMAETKLD